MSKEFEAYIESGRKVMEQLDNYIEVAKKVKKVVEDFWSNAKVYVFGSVLEDKHTAISDIDILIVTDNINQEDAYKVKAIIHRTIDAPVELHVTSTYEFNHWYKRFLNEIEEIP